MSTTRHLINRQRRLATTASRTSAPATGDGAAKERLSTPGPARSGRHPNGRRAAARAPGKDAARGSVTGEAATSRRARLKPVLAVLAVLTVLLGGFAAFAADRAADLRDQPSARNTALTDIARTSEVKGQITEAVESVFSYNFADAAALDQSVQEHLTGNAVQQHDEMLAAVRKEGPKQKLVLTTTVTGTGVELIDGDRARVLVYADQSNTRTATKEETTYAAAMLAVDAVHRDGTWRITGIDTFGNGS
ncbi:hypothetical protein ABZ070_00595 [Streptomyces sp. NPDC006283]|uniref:hypothetical protein n=1 Tax=Streptomyces sp. NPDC006283 TaxID=3156741 RepID=UPI0033B9ED6A